MANTTADKTPISLANLARNNDNMKEYIQSEIDKIPTGGSITIDEALSNTSENPVQNKVVTEALDEKVNSSDISMVATTGSYNDLSDKPTIPSEVTETTVSGWGFTKNTGTYSKPSGGIPKSDLASSVQTSLGKADTALQQHQSLADYVKTTDSRLSDARTPTAHTHDDRYYTESEIDTKLNTKLNASLKGAVNGLAELDTSGKVPSSQLPSYVDDVLEYTNQSSFPTTGESGKIYIAQDTNKTYRWSGSAYVEISPSLALGETSATAYRGDRGKVAYEHSQSTHARTDATKVEKSSTNGNIKINGTETTVYTHPSGTNPHGTTKSDVGLGNVGNFKAVSTVINQGLTEDEKANARDNIGAGTSSFSGSYDDLTNKPDSLPADGGNADTVDGYHVSDGLRESLNKYYTEFARINHSNKTIEMWSTKNLKIPLADKATNAENAYTVNNHTVYSNVPVDAVFTDTIYDDTQIKSDIANKVDKVEGKGLSTNDLTATLKSNYDKAYIHSQSTHAPTDAQANVIETIKVNGAALTPSSKAVDITVPNVVDNLTSTDATKSLSANQGKVLKGLVDGKAASSHNQASNTINAMTGYSKPSNTSAITTADSLNTAIGKLEKALDAKGTSNLTIGTTASTAAAGNHTHSSYVNQNAFSNITVGSTTVAADSATDTLTLAGSNVTLTPDATNDKITIGITKANVTSALGYTPPTTNTTYSTGTASKAGITKLYSSTGTNTDGTMTQEFLTERFNNIKNIDIAEVDNYIKENENILPIGRTWTGLAYGNNTWVMVGSGGTPLSSETQLRDSSILYSYDNKNWNEALLPVKCCLYNVKYAHGLFLAIGTNANFSKDTEATQHYFLYSSDGINWSYITKKITANSTDICIGCTSDIVPINDNLIIITPYKGSKLYKLQVSNGTIQLLSSSLVIPATISNNTLNMCYGNNTLVGFLGNSTTIMVSSTNGVNWGSQNLFSSSISSLEIIFANNKFYIFTHSKVYISSENDITSWSSYDINLKAGCLGGILSLRKLLFTNNKFIGLDADGILSYSYDGINWYNKRIFRISTNISKNSVYINIESDNNELCISCINYNNGYYSGMNTNLISTSKLNNLIKEGV